MKTQRISSASLSYSSSSIALIGIVYFLSQAALGTRVLPNRLPTGDTSSADDEYISRQKRDDNYQQFRNKRLTTRLVGDVEVVVQDPHYTDEKRDLPVTLSPRLVQDRFAVRRAVDGYVPIQAQEIIRPTSVVKTEYSTFTYFVTSLNPAGQTVTSTDIIVSSNVVTETIGVEPTPGLSNQFNLASPTVTQPPAYQVEATKTYFTTSTYYTTLIDQGNTLTRSRTRVRSSVITETYAADTNNGVKNNGFSTAAAYEPFKSVPKDTSSKVYQAVKYSSLGPNIYARIKTLFDTLTFTYTDLSGSLATSKEIITQTSTSLFSTTKLPATVTLDGANSQGIGTSVQLSPSRLAQIKQSFLDGKTEITNVNPSTQTALVDNDGNLATKPGASIIWDKPYLSSLKDSYQSSINAATSSDSIGTSALSENDIPVTDVDLPGNGPPILRPPGSTGAESDISSIAPTKPQDQSSIVLESTSGESESSNQDNGNQQNTPEPLIQDNQQSTPTQENNNENGGVINAVVGGIAEGLGDVFGTSDPNPLNGLNALNVDLGPVLDAVATLLRGPIRSAIANRRSEAIERSDGPENANLYIRPSRTVERAVLPSVAREPINNQNYIPVGGLGRTPSSQSGNPRPRYDFIPIQQRQSRPKGGQRGNGPIPLALRREAQPRIDYGAESEYNQNYLNGDISNVVKQNFDNQYGDDRPYLNNNGSIIINDHIIEANDPTIIDVLSRNDQAHLFGNSNGPMEIEIVAGIPMNVPQQYGAPRQQIHVKDGIVVEPLNPQSNLSPPPPKGGYQKKQRPGLRRPEHSRPRPPPIGNRPPSQTTSQRRPPVNNRPYPPRPNPNNKPPTRPLPNGPQAPKRPPYPRKPGQSNAISNTIDSQDSDNQFSINNEVVVPAPPNVVQTSNKPLPSQNGIQSQLNGPKRPINGRPKPVPNRPNYPARPSTTNTRPSGSGIRQPNIPKRPESFGNYPRKPAPLPNRPPNYPQRPNTVPKRPYTNQQRPPIRKPISPQRPNKPNAPQSTSQRQPGPPRRPSIPNKGRKPLPPRPTIRHTKNPSNPNGPKYPIRQPSLTRRPPQTPYFSNPGTRNQPPKSRYPTNQIDIVDGSNKPQHTGTPNSYENESVGQNRPSQYGQTSNIGHGAQSNPSNVQTSSHTKSPGYQVVTTLENQAYPTSPTNPEQQGPFKVSQQGSKPINSEVTNTGLYVSNDGSTPVEHDGHHAVKETNIHGNENNNQDGNEYQGLHSQRQPDAGVDQQNRPLSPINSNSLQLNGIRPSTENERNDKPSSNDAQLPQINLGFSQGGNSLKTPSLSRPNQLNRPKDGKNEIRDKSPSGGGETENGTNKPPYTSIDEPSAGPPHSRPRPSKFGNRPQRIPSNANRYQYGDRVPYNDNNPNKKRRPNGARPTGFNRVDPSIASTVKDNVGATGYGVQLAGSVGDLTVTNSLGELQVIQTTFNWVDTGIEPSFTQPIANQDRKTDLPRPQRTRTPQKNNVDYEGWNTDTNDDPSVIRLSSSYFDDLPLVEKEGQKTTTYANEWLTYDPANGNGNTKIRFTPQSRPKLNTNFAGEWTPTGTLYNGITQTESPGNNVPIQYNTRTNANWNAGTNVGGHNRHDNLDDTSTQNRPGIGNGKGRQPASSPNQQPSHSQGAGHNWNSNPSQSTPQEGSEAQKAGHNWSSHPSSPTPEGGSENPTSNNDIIDGSGLQEDDSSFGGSSPIRGRPVRPTRPTFGGQDRESEQNIDGGNPRQRPTELFITNSGTNGIRRDQRPGVTPSNSFGTTIRRPGDKARRPLDGPIPTDGGVTSSNNFDSTDTRPRPGQSNRPPFGNRQPPFNRPNGPTRGPIRLRPLNGDFESPITRPRPEQSNRPSFGNRQPSFGNANFPTRDPIRNRPQRPAFPPRRNDGVTRLPIEGGRDRQTNQPFFDIPIDTPTGEPTRFSPQPPTSSDNLIGIDLEPSLDEGDETKRRQREPVVKPFRPTPEKDNLGDDYIEVVEGTFEPSLPTVPFKTDDLPFTTNVVVSGGFGGKGDKPSRTSFQNEIDVSPSTARDTDRVSGQNTRRTRIKITRTVTRTKIRLPTIGIRPSSVRPDLVRPTVTPSGFDSSESTSTGGFRPKGPSRRPKFPPRTRPSGPVRDNTKGDVDENEDLISLIPIDRTTETDDNLREDEDDPRVLTGGPFIPNFGGGGRPGRPIKEKNTGLGSATLQKGGTGSSSGTRDNASNSPNGAAAIHDGEKRRQETALDGAIVESIPAKTLSAEDSDPQTRCKNTCGENENCVINIDGGIDCRCRPGFGRNNQQPSAACTKSRSFQIEVLTSGREKITVVRLSPKAVQQAVEETFRKTFLNIKDIYHGSEISSIKVGNDSRRNTFYGGEKNLTRDQDMAINLIVHIADDGTEDAGIAEEKLKSDLESPLKGTKFPLGSDITVSRVSIQDFDECASDEHNDCADQAECTNVKGTYECYCKVGYHDLSGPDSNQGRVCSATTTECDLCNKNGQCIVSQDSQVSCECRAWFAGRNCQINLKLLLIVGCVSVILMVVIACGVSCFCCRERGKNDIPSPYGTTMSRVPPSIRSHGLMMDPHGGGHKPRKGMMPRPGIQKHHPGAGYPPSASSVMGMVHHPPNMLHPAHAMGSGPPSMPSMTSHHSGSLARSGHHHGHGHGGPSAWQASLSDIHQEQGSMSHRGPSANPALVIPRAKVKRSSAERGSNAGMGGGYTNAGYHSDDDAVSHDEANRAMSEHMSMSSRHRRKSVPHSFASGILGSTHSGRGSQSRRARSSTREGSIDPLLLGDGGSYSDGEDSTGNRMSTGTLPLSVSRTEIDRADARSDVRSYNETIIRPVTRRLASSGVGGGHSVSGTSVRSRTNRSYAGTSEDGRAMAERDGGSSFVVSPRHQLYRLHDSDGSLDSL